MKNLLTATLPALGLLALGGCATTGALSSTENDGVYYSSNDRTTAVATAPAASYQANANGYPAANSANVSSPYSTQTQTTAPAAENANPDYQGGTTQSTAATTSGSDYYDDSYSSQSATPSAFGQPYTGPGVSSVNYSPTWSVSPSFYGSPFGYGLGLSFGYGLGGYGGYGYSPFGYGYGYPGYGGFYDPFYSPWGYGSGLSLGFGYGFGYPYYGGGFGYPYGFGSPYAYGYPYGAGYYGDYYGGGYSRPVIYANGTRSGTGTSPVLVGPRSARGGAVLNRAAGSPATTGVNSNPINIGRRGIAVDNSGGIAPGSYNAAQPAGAAPTAGRGAWRAATFGGGEVVGQPAATPNPTATQPRQEQNAGRRGGFFRDVFGGGTGANANAGSVGADQQMQRRTYSQPDYQQRSYNQPSRSFEQRSFSPAPQRSFGGGGGNFGGGGGGGSFGGGGGGGGRRR